MASLKPTLVSDPEKAQPQQPPTVDDAARRKALAIKRESTGDELTVVSQDGDDDLVDAPGEPHLDEKTEQSEYLVRWDGPDDPENPKNWGRTRRWYITGVAGLLVLNCTFASSAPAGILDQIIDEFNLSHTLAVLTIGLFVAGYCVGPLAWGPLSEQYGRRPVTLIAFFVYTCFQIGSALAPNTGAVLAFRFLGGTFAASPLTTSGGIIADIWDAGTRGKAMAIFTLAPFAGPAIGPIVGGYIDVGGASWRWLFWVLTMFAGACWVLVFLTIPETYAPVIQQRKAARKRKETGNEKWFAELDAEDVHWRARIETVLGRPFKVLFLEPMLIALTLYISFVYGCVYLLFEAYPIVYNAGHHLNNGEGGLVFLPLFSGGVAACTIYVLYFNPQYERFVKQYAPAPVPPEQRLRPAFFGGPLLIGSFLWFGWTSYPSLSIWAPMFSGFFMGIAVIFIFLSLLNYIVDAYLRVAASALAANTVVRSAFGAGFPLFATQMYDKLNPRWASTLLAGITLLLVPVPFILYRYGETIRRTSKYAPTP